MQDIASSLLSERMQRIDTSEIRRVFQLAATLQNPINLSIGQPHYAAPEPIREAVARALRDGATAYTETAGIRPLRERLARKFNAENAHIKTVDPDNILVSSGVSSLIQHLLFATIDPGDRVLLTDPAFLIYRGMLRYLNARIETVPEDFNRADLDAINPTGLKLIVYCSPSNPSGRIMDREQIAALGELAERSGALLAADEIYELFDYEGKFTSGASVYPDAVTLMGFSKSYSMTGLRLSAATGPAPLIRAMTTLQQYTVVCAPAPVQHAGIVALDLDMSEYVDLYRRNRDRCAERLTGKLNFMRPDGAFYMFAELPEGAGEDRAFVERAIREKELLLVPGRIFSEKTNWFRLSYATEPETLERGLDALSDLLDAGA